ncbi:hypothetical protein [Streptomyces mirabilis]|uniref:hypothetical protein n=1 Tax=Streptomyces mirabilis TaxID=68239 RepID=UPI0036C6BDC1
MASGGYEQTGTASSFGWPAISLLGLLVLLGAPGALMLLSAFIGGVAGMTEVFRSPYS